MKRFFFIFLYISIIVFFIHPEKKLFPEIDPDSYLRKADDAVKIDPDLSMDLAKSVRLFLIGSDNEYLEIKARLIIGKALFYKDQFQKSLKTLGNVKARISILKVERSKEKLSALCSESMYWIGEVYLKLNRYKKALESYKKGSEYFIDKKPTNINSKIIIAISRTYIILSEYENALSYAIRGAKSAEETGDIDSLFFSSYLHGYVYRQLKDYDKGLIKFKKSLKTAENYKRMDLKILAINEISNIFILQKKYDKALELKQNALNLAKQTGNSAALSYCLNDISHIFIEKKEYKKALPYLIRSKDLAKENSDVRGVVISDKNIAETYLKTGNISNSWKIATNALSMAEKYGLKAEMLELTKFLSELSFRMNKFKDAYRYLNRSFDLNREIFSAEKSNKIAELETEREMEKSENRILLLEKVNQIKQLELDEQNRFITLQKVTTFMLLIIAFLIFLAYRWKRIANLELEKKGEELEKTLSEVHKLSGLLPICSSCKKIRDDSGYWHQVEEFIKSHSEASFSHSVCPSCLKKIYPKRKNTKSASKGKTRKKE